MTPLSARDRFGLRCFALLALLWCAMPFSFGAQSGEMPIIDVQGQGGSLGAAALWERFVDALRLGRMREAYACFSPLSRRHLSYEAFCLRHHPLMLSGEILLSPAEDGRLQLSGDVAVLRFVAVPAEFDRVRNSAEGILVTALLVREERRWYLVAEERLDAARAEAEARNLLRRLAGVGPIVEAIKRGERLSTEAVRRLAPEVFRPADATACLERYAIELRGGGITPSLLALPRLPDLRAFGTDDRGEVHEAHVEGDRVTLVLPLASPEPAPSDAASIPPDLGDPAATDTSSLSPPNDDISFPDAPIPPSRLPRNEVLWNDGVPSSPSPTEHELPRPIPSDAIEIPGVVDLETL